MKKLIILLTIFFQFSLAFSMENTVQKKYSTPLQFLILMSKGCIPDLPLPIKFEVVEQMYEHEIEKAQNLKELKALKEEAQKLEAEYKAAANMQAGFARLWFVIAQRKLQILQAIDNKRKELGVKFPDDWISTGINAQDRKGNTLLHHAVQTENPELAHILLENGPDVNIKGRYGSTPIYLTVLYNKNNKEERLKIVKKLLNLGAVITQNKEQTVLHYAAENGCIDMMKLLLSQGADINVQDRDGKTPIHCFPFWKGHALQ